jgi:hypothetical protein
MSRAVREKIKTFQLLKEMPQYAGHQYWTDPRKPSSRGRRWTRNDLDLYKYLGGTFNNSAGPHVFVRGGKSFVQINRSITRQIQSDPEKLAYIVNQDARRSAKVRRRITHPRRGMSRAEFNKLYEF